MAKNNDFLYNYKISNEKEIQNFFQIAGFPHYENIFSNVLAFFIEEQPLIYKSILDCLNIHDDNDRVEEVIREDRTDKNKRIDLIIRTQKRIIGIENKIDAGLYNDTTNYYKHLNDIAINENKELFCIILSKNKINNIPKYFINVLHTKLADIIKNYYDEMSKNMDERYFILLKEFIKNIDFLNRGTLMDKSFLEILDNEEYLEKIEDIIKNYFNIKREMDNKYKELLLNFNDGETFEQIWKNNDVDSLGYFQINTIFQNFTIKKDYGLSIEVGIYPLKYDYEITGHNKKSDENFHKLMKKILPDYENYKEINENTIAYDPAINDFNILVDKLKEVITHFKKYRKQ